MHIFTGLRAGMRGWTRCLDVCVGAVLRASDGMVGSPPLAALSLGDDGREGVYPPSRESRIGVRVNAS